MEIACRNNHILVREDVGIVGSRVYLILYHRLYIHDIVLYGTVDLGYAPETVRVLDMLLGTVDKFAAGKNRHKTLAGGNLPRMRTQLMRKGKERFYAAVESIERHGSYQVCPAGKAHALEYAPDGMGAHELGAVEKSQSLFRLQGYRLPSLLHPYFSGRTYPAFVKHLAKANQRQAEMSQRRKVSGCSERALLVHYRKDILVEHVHKPLHGLELYPGMTVGEVLHLQEKHKLYYLGANCLSGSAGVRDYQIVLQARQVLLWYGHVVERTKTCGYSVERTVYFVCFAVKIFPAFDYGSYRSLGKFKLFVVVDYLFQALKSEAFIGNYVAHDY